jgi:hypothetical protein
LRLAGTLPDGALVDEECYSLTREEYAADVKKDAAKAAAPDAAKPGA